MTHGLICTWHKKVLEQLQIFKYMLLQSCARQHRCKLKTQMVVYACAMLLDAVGMVAMNLSSQQIACGVGS